MTSEQIKAVRALLGWSRDRLAARLGVCASRLKALEIGAQQISDEEQRAFSAVIESAGVEFSGGTEPDVKPNRRAEN
jgi:transcriptional regulator with XRE-family HTH domain